MLQKYHEIVTKLLQLCHNFVIIKCYKSITKLLQKYDEKLLQNCYDPDRLLSQLTVEQLFK